LLCHANKNERIGSFTSGHSLGLKDKQSTLSFEYFPARTEISAKNLDQTIDVNEHQTKKAWSEQAFLVIQ